MEISLTTSIEDGERTVIESTDLNTTHEDVVLEHLKSIFQRYDALTTVTIDFKGE